MNCVLCKSHTAHPHYEKIDPQYGKRVYWRCEICSLIYLPSEYHLSPANEKARYDEHQNNPTDLQYRQFLEKLTSPLKQRLREKVRGLDYGSGPGPTTSVMMEEAGFPMENYDPFYAPNSSALEKQFNFITCSETVEHFKNPRRNFLRLHDMLEEKEGILAVMTQLIPDDKPFSEWWYHKDPTHIAFYSKRTFCWIAEWMGLRIEFPASSVILLSKPSVA